MKTFGVAREENKKINKAKNMIILSIICHRYFDTNHFITWFVYFLLNILWSKDQNFFQTLGGQIIYFIYKNCQTPPRNQLVVPKINQEINEPSYEMVGVKITVTNYGQNNRIFGKTKYS
jgi:uncharacterized lipoprotein YajG